MPPKIHRDFPIQVSRLNPKSRRYRVRVIGPVVGGQPGFDELETCVYNAEPFTDESGGQGVGLLEAVRTRQATEAQLVRLGTLLSDLILPGSVRIRLQDSLRVVHSLDQGLRLRLLIEAPELATLPWDYMYLKLDQAPDSEIHFLALQPFVSIVRHAAIDVGLPWATERSAYRLVAALAGPADQPPLNLDADRQAIERIATGTFQSRKMAPILVAGATRRSLRAALRAGADLFHFSGHGIIAGRSGQIILHQAGGSGSDYYDARQLASLLRDAGVRLAVLSACQAVQGSLENPWGRVASALVEAGVPAVVASRYTLQDRNAQLLAEELYGALIAGESVDGALYRARQAIYREAGLTTRDWGALTLYLRLEDGVLFPTPLAAGHDTAPPIPQTVIHANINIAGNVVNSNVYGVFADTIGAAVSSALSTPPAPQPPRWLLPKPEGELLGRQQEWADALDALGRGRKCYFYGPYGVGKTRLANDLFYHLGTTQPFKDGTLWGRVAKMDTAAVLEWVAAHLQVLEVARAPNVEAKLSALQRILSQRSDLLIALDDVADASVARDLLSAAAGCPVILNGSRNLELSDLALEMPLKPLAPADAAQLFHYIASRLRESDGPRERELVGLICGRMRYLPLGIRLAARKHAEGESLENLYETLQAAPEVLVADDDALSAIFMASYNDVKRESMALSLWVRLASFPAFEAPEDLLRTGMGRTHFIQAKNKLLHLDLVTYAAPGRLALHPLIGAGLQQVEPQAVDEERRKTFQWLGEYANQNRFYYDSLQREHENLLSLLDWYEDEREWDALVTLMREVFNYLRVRGLWQDAFRRLDTVLQSADLLQEPWNRGWTYLHRGIMHTLRSSYGLARADFEQADRIFSELEDLAYRGTTLYRVAILSIVAGDAQQAVEQLRQALEWMGDEAPSHDRAAAHERLAHLLALRGDLTLAQEQYACALKLGDDEEKARVHIALGELTRKAGLYDQTLEHFGQARQLSEKLGHILQRATIEQEMGYVHYYQGRFDEALHAFEAALGIFQQLQYSPGLAQMQHALGNVALASGDLDGARRHYQAAIDTTQATGQLANLAYNRYQLGVVLQRMGQHPQAAQLFNDVLEVAINSADVTLQASALFQLGSVAFEDGDRQVAAERFARALALSKKMEDRLIEASALYYTGLLQAQEGLLEAARGTLSLAHASFAALGSVDTEKVSTALKTLIEGSGGSLTDPVPSTSMHVDVVQAGGQFLLSDQVVNIILPGGHLVGCDLSKVDLGVLKSKMNVEPIDVIQVGGTIIGAKIDRLG